MSAFDVYSIYLGVKTHFTSKKYDYFRYEGRTRTSEEKFNKRNDRYFFEKLSKKFTKEEIEQYFVSNFLSTLTSTSKRWKIVTMLSGRKGRKVFLICLLKTLRMF